MATSVVRARSFVDADGQRWLVREHTVIPCDGGPPHPVLLFESRFVARWTRRYPAHWQVLSDEELEALSWQV